MIEEIDFLDFLRSAKSIPAICGQFGISTEDAEKLIQSYKNRKLVLADAFKKECYRMSLDFGLPYFETLCRNQTYEGGYNQKASKKKIERIIQQIEENTKLLFCDEKKNPYAWVDLGDHWEVWSIHTRQFKSWAAKILYETDGEAASSEQLNSAINVISAKASFSGEKPIELFNRISRNETGIFYDMCNSQWDVICITKEGWKLYNPKIPMFKRYSHQKEQCYPDKNAMIDDLNLLRPFVNVATEDDWLLTAVWVVAALIPNIPRPIMIRYGQKGSVKTCGSLCIRNLIDPSVCMINPLKTEAEMAQIFSHHYLPIFDNCSHISKEQSDSLCKAVTGDGFSKRELFTNDDDVIYTFKRGMIMTGISIPISQPDLLDRALLIEVGRIDSKSRKDEETLFAEFDQKKPKILGAMFTILSTALSSIEEIRLDEKPRMADFAKFGEAIATTLGYRPGEFLIAYKRNIAKQSIEALDSNLLAPVIEYLMEDRSEWKGTATSLLSDLTMNAQLLHISTNQQQWPKGANQLSRRLKELAPSLEDARGIKIEWSKSGHREIHIYKTVVQTVSSSFSTLESIAKPTKQDDIEIAKPLDTVHIETESYPSNNEIGHKDSMDDTSNSMINSEREYN